jgi:hypothetical protein
MAFGRGFEGSDVTHTWFWGFPGVAYVLITIFTFYSARRLGAIDAQILAKYNADYFSDEAIEKMKRDGWPLIIDKQTLANERKISSQEWDYWKKVFGIPYELEANKREAENFKNASKLNRGFLYAAAASFVIAAGISFAQGLSLI